MTVSFEVTPESAQTTDDVVVAPPRSPLESLKAKRQALVDKLYLELIVPRWDEDPDEPLLITVRYKPVGTVKMEKSLEARSKSKDDEWTLLIQADILADSCLGIYAQVPDDPTGTKRSLRIGDEFGPWTRFDADLAANLGVQTAKAVDVVRALYLTDGDLLNAAQRLIEWSGQSKVKADEDFTKP